MTERSKEEIELAVKNWKKRNASKLSPIKCRNCPNDATIFNEFSAKNLCDDCFHLKAVEAESKLYSLGVDYGSEALMKAEDP